MAPKYKIIYIKKDFNQNIKKKKNHTVSERINRFNYLQNINLIVLKCKCEIGK